MKRAFTLAEVLITLGIIGVVVAITIPNVVKNYQKNVMLTQVKKTYTDLQEVIKRSIADNGDLNTWDFSLSNGKFVRTYIKPYIKNIKLSSTWGQPQDSYNPYTLNGKKISWEALLYLSDGRILFFQKGTNYFWLAFDINGEKGPNIFGKDVFVLDLIGYYRNRTRNTADGRVDFWGDGASLNDIKGSGSYGCSKNCKGNYCGFFCGSWIKSNNWKIPDDYPW